MRINWQEERAKVERLELLYQADGRHERSHPLHGRYTGLALTAPSASEQGLSALAPTAASPGPSGGAPSVGAPGELPSDEHPTSQATGVQACDRGGSSAP